MLKKLLPLLSLFLFISCDFLYGTLEDISSVTNKTTYKSFSHLNNPIVISMPVHSTRYLFRNKNNNAKREKVGDIFVIIDWETNEVYDWCFYGNSNQTVWDRPVEACQNPVRYFNPVIDKNQIIELNPNNTTVTTIPVTNIGLFYNNNTPGDYCVIDSYGWNNNTDSEEINFRLFDCEKQTFSSNKLSQPVNCSSYISMLIPDNIGDLWFSYLFNGYAYVSKLCCSSEELITLDLRFPCKKNTEGSNYDFSCSVLYACNSYILLSKFQLGKGPYNDNKLYKINLNNNEVQEIDISFSEYSFLSRIVKIENTIYCIINNSDNNQKCIDICQLNEETLTLEKLNDNEKFFISYTDNLWVRDNRIYFMDSWNTKKIFYNYFDVQTCEQGQGWTIIQEDVIKN